jgi:hypothetical protein
MCFLTRVCISNIGYFKVKYDCWHVACGSTYWKNILPWCCSDGGSVENSPSSPTLVDDLLELTLDTSDSEDDDWRNNQRVIECTSKVKVRTVMYTGCPRSPLIPDLFFYLFISSYLHFMDPVDLCEQPNSWHRAVYIAMLFVLSFMAFIVLKRQRHQWWWFIVQYWFIMMPRHFYLLLFSTCWDAVITLFIVWPVSYVLCTQTNTLECNNSSYLPLSVSHNTQLIMIKCDLGCWCGMALSHTDCHTGLLGHV